MSCLYCGGLPHDANGRILIDLDASDDPAWDYLDHQHANILESIQQIYNAASERCRKSANECTSSPTAESIRRELEAAQSELLKRRSQCSS